MKKILVLGLLFILSLVSVSALDKGYCVQASVNDITPSSVELGEEFTVGIAVENCGETIPEQVSFELKDLGPYISVKEPLKKDIGKMSYANSERFMVYHMKVSNDARPGSYVIRYELTYGKLGLNFSKTGDFSVDVIGDEAELSISSLKTNPVLPKEGENVELTLRVENTGDGSAKSIEVYLDHPFKGVKQSFIGALNPDEDGAVVFTFIATKKGEFEFPVNISYKDDFGWHEIKTNVNFDVLKKESNTGMIILVILLVIVFGGGIYYFIKTKKSKDKIIHQLLGDNNSGAKEKK